MKVRYSICMLMVTLLLLVGCAGMAVEDQYKTYVTIETEFTSLAEQYEVWYQGAPPEQQEAWRGSVDPLFIRADSLLDQYKSVLLAGESPEAIINQLKIIKTQLLMELARRAD